VVDGERAGVTESVPGVSKRYRDDGADARVTERDPGHGVGELERGLAGGRVQNISIVEVKAEPAKIMRGTV